MNIRFLIPGKCREKYLNEGVNEYLKRLSKYAKVTLSYLPEEYIQDERQEALIKKALENEASRVLKLLKEDEFVFLIDVHGQKMDSSSFAKFFEEKAKTNGNFAFVFGSSYGIDDRLRKRADFKFSLSDLTFTHYVALFLTIEQVYRAMKIIRGETYDK